MRKIVIGITGASGTIYAARLLEKLEQIKAQYEDAAVVFSRNAQDVWKTELGNEDWKKLRFKIYDIQDFSAPFASGSGKYDLMIIVPCSMGMLARIAQGISNDLISRAADVVLKERRKLICVVRETPYNLMHIRNMEALTLAGGIVCAANPSFYSRPDTIEKLVDTVVDRILDLAGFQISTYRWGNEV
ncbi:MAG: UbiX family flavin prenyltransferase [Chitinophagaceae bacterium]|nr:UbiX family flavin prenyltransferase [Chitinophagaceae bacterium]